MAKAKKNKGKLKKKLTKKFRLVVLNEDSFEERFSFKLTRLNVFVLSGVFSIFLIVSTVFLIAFTPIKEYIPGYASTKLKKDATALFYKVDSLQSKIKTIEKYAEEVLQPTLKGEEVEANLLSKPQISNEKVVLFESSNNDSIQKVIDKMQKSLDSTWKVYYEKEKNFLEKQHLEKIAYLDTSKKDTLAKVTEDYTLLLQEQIDSVKGLQLQLDSNKKAIADLEKQISLKDIELKLHINSLSNENKEIASQAKKSSEKIRKEVQEVLREEYSQREKSLKELYEEQIALLNTNVLAQEARIDSLLTNRQKTIGELNPPHLVAELDSTDAKLLVRSRKDSIFREKVAREDRFSLFDFETDKVETVFSAPVKGIVTDTYNIKDKHFAVDIAVTKGTAVKSVANGIIIFAEWTAETGYVVIIEHENKYLSVYKHNEIIYREQGDLVQTGEVISQAGSSGEYSTGPHLHFEMWYEGYPVNPVNFIEFE